MGRRALPKIDPAIVLSQHLLRLEEVPQPWNPTQLFGRTAPVELEIGSGKGLFLRSAAAARPDHDFLGIEIAPKYARFAASRLAKEGLANAKAISGDGQRLLAEWVPVGAIAALHVYFPDPWWKKRHHKRRLMNESFVAQIERVLTPGGRLHFWTDVQDYFAMAVETLRTCTKLAGPLPVDEKPPDHDLDYRTHFERRMRMNAKPVYRSEYVKESQDAAAVASEL